MVEERLAEERRLTKKNRQKNQEKIRLSEIKAQRLAEVERKVEPEKELRQAGTRLADESINEKEKPEGAESQADTTNNKLLDQEGTPGCFCCEMHRNLSFLARSESFAPSEVWFFYRSHPYSKLLITRLCTEHDRLPFKILFIKLCMLHKGLALC
jgi:hypothetical protein